MTQAERQHAADTVQVLERLRKALDRAALREPVAHWVLILLFTVSIGGYAGIVLWAILGGKTGANAPYIFLFAPFAMLMTTVRSSIVRRLRPELDEVHEVRFVAPFSEIESEMKTLLSVFPPSAIATLFVNLFLFFLLAGGLAASVAVGCLPQTLFVYLMGSINLLAIYLFERGRLRKLHDWIAGMRCKCGYDLVGSAAGRCPECGVKIPIASVREMRVVSKDASPPIGS